MEAPRTPAGRRILALVITLAILCLAVAGRLWLRSPQPPTAEGLRNAASQETATGAAKKPTASAGSEEAATGAPSAAVAAERHEHRGKLPNFDVRAGGTGGDDDKRQRALAALREKIRGVDVQFDPITGAPNHIMATGRFLAGAKGRAGDTFASVRDFVNEYADLFGHDATAINDSRVTRDDVTAHNGMRTVVWQQQVDGIPVYKTILKANLTKDGALVTLGSHFMSDALAATGMDVVQRTALVAQPPVDVRKAISLAAANLGDAVAPEQALEASQPEGAERMQRFTAPKLSDTFAQLSWLPVTADAAKLTWDVTLMSLKQNEMFRVLVDARTGEVLMRTSLTADISNASYRVYADGTTLQPFDSPSPMSPGLSTPTSTQPAEVSRNLVTTPALDTTASPNGWINDGGIDTYGNNVDAHLDLSSTNPTYGTGTHATSATRVFDFTLDLTQAPASYQSAVVTQLFYACNYYHDKLYALGFTESAGNFQQNNFGKGGNGNDAVLADAQDGSGTNNANFSTPSDGSPGRMQMFVFTGPTPDRDGDLDMEIVFHEHTHGVSNRLVGGGTGISALQTQGMGEGWSDFYGLCLLSQPGDDVNGNYAAGAYATNQLSGLTSNYYYGIRRYPYSTDMTKNPLTFKDIDPTQASAHATVPHSPIFSAPNVNSSEVHNQGEIWCVALWDVRANLVTKLGAAAGNQMVLKLVTDGMKLSPANPTFLQARDAIIQADLVDNAGANKNELWAAFAKRGMGSSATVPVNSTTTGLVEAFDIPDNLGVTPFAAFASSGQIGGPFSPASQVYTLTNNGASSLSWNASVNQTWLSVSTASGTLASGATTTVTVSITALANGLSAGSYAGTASFTNATSGAVIARQASLSVSPPRVAYFDLTTDPGWTRQGEWAFGTPTGAGGTSNGFHDPTSGATGVNVFGINLSGDYSTTVGGPYYLTTGAINLTNFAGSQLRFKRWLNTDYPGYVYATVQVSNDATNWTTVFTNVSGTAITDSAWTTVQYDISAVADNHSTVYVRWGHQIGSSGAFAYSGWNIDDVEILAAPQTSLALSLSPATVTEGAAPVTATLTASPAPVADTVVALSSSDTASATVPATVTIPPGQASVTFPVTVLDDTVLNGSRGVLLIANTTGYTNGTATLTVNDNETATLTVTAPASATEGVGTVQGTVTVSAAPVRAVAVTLTSSDTTALQVPATVTIPAGQTSANFTITIIDDNKINGTRPVLITAHVANWTDGTAGINVLDNENTNLTVTLPASVTEGGTGTGTVSISGTLTTALTVALGSNNTSRLTVPASVSIPAGSTSATFTLTAPDNALTDGTATVTITAGAAGFTSGTQTTNVLDNDVHHFTVSAIASPQGRGVAFSITLTAKDVNGVTVATYTGTPALAASGTGGANSITPTVTTAFTAGVWTGNVTDNTFDTNVVLTVNDGAGHTGASNAFNVGSGALHHFAWSTQAVRAQGAAVSATVTAQDAGNNTVTSFAGTANLSGYASSPSGSSIVITELNTNTPDEIEFMNVGTAAVDISGWKIYIYDNTTFGTSALLFTVPAGTTCAAGQIFRLQEFGTSPGTFPQFYYGANINWNPGSSDYVGVLVRDAANNNVDFVCAAALAASAVTSPATIPASQWTGAQLTAPTNSSYDYLRIGSTDSNSATGWTTGTAGMGTANTGLTTPFGIVAAVTVSPTVSGTFSSGVWTGNMTVLQTASQMKFRADDGSGHTGDSNAFDVTGTLSLSVPASAVEGSAPVTGTVSVSSAPSTALTVTLSSSDLTAATVPATVTIPAGQTSATFPITIIDDTIIDGTQVATITAQITGWANATANISVLDNETTTLSLFLPGTVTEGTTATATVSASGTVVSALTVSLVSGTPSRLTVPATVVIPGGSSSVTFNVTAVENTLTDGSATVNVAATASGFTGTNANTTVLDNDAHHFSIAAIASPQTKNVAFNVSITAFDVGNAILTGYNGTPGLTASGTGGANAISPANASGFVNGVWTGQVTSFVIDTNVVLTVNDGAGHTGTSNAFNVVAPLFSPTVLEPVSPANLLPGNNPKAQLILGADGAFYGTTQFGGSSNLGTVFKVTSAGALTTLANFYGGNGAQPWSGLVLASDGNFYGTTSSGGLNNLGTIFKMTPSGTLTTLVHLSTTTGTVPKAPLLQASDGNFYGTTSSGGSSGSGTVFKMTTSGVLTVLVNFTGTTSTAYGSSCQAGLIQASDTNFYGVTSSGGVLGFGTIFKVTTGGTFTSLASFTGTTGATLGSAPLAALVQASDGILYGTTSVGGTLSAGTVFKVTTAGVFTNLLSFTNTTGSFLGYGPQAALVQWTDGNLYGTTNNGGTGGSGSIFRVTTAGVLTTLRSISITPDGQNPYGALVPGSDGNFYGAATSGGTLGKGTVFNISPATSTFTRVFSFVTSPPVFKRLLLATDGNFYGVTTFGNAGSNSVFKLTPGGTLSTLTAFTSTNTNAPFMIQGSDGRLYVAAPLESTYGQLFSLTLAGARTTLATFTATSGAVLGSSVVGGIVEGSDGLIYGTTASGGSGGNFGTAWKITTGGTFTSLGSFTGTTGAAPGSLPQTRMTQGADGNFYGTTQSGGAGGFGTVFKATPAGVLTTLVQFTGTTGAFPGSTPNTSLLLASDGNFYGTATAGGAANAGTIFKIAPDGSFTSLLSFTGSAAGNFGTSPSTNLIQGSDGNLYGTTQNGGTSGAGTVFKVTPAGVLTTLVSFTGTTGVAPGTTPNGTLIQAGDGYFYGTTTSGGFYNLGTVFRVSSSGIFQSLYTIGSSNDGGSPNISGSSLYPDGYRLIAGTDGYLYGVNTSSVFRVHQQPAVQSIGATGITTTGAMLSGSAVPNQDAATVYYQYGFNTAYGSQTTAQNLSAGTWPVPVNASLSGLLPGAIYHFRMVTVTAQGTFYTGDQTFATTSAPLVITGSFTNAGQTGFSLDGVVNPLGNSTSYYFEYGTSTAYGAQTATQSAGGGIADVPVNTAVNSLLPGTPYHVRLVATNSVGTTLGDDQVIPTFPVTTGTIQPVSQYLSTGTAPLAGLFKAGDGNFYGTMSTGGTFGSAGTVFRMTQGGTLTTLANFYNNTNATLSGSNPQGSLVQGADGNFYGTTNTGGNASGYGTIFKMTPAGQVTILNSFNYFSAPMGANPISGLTVGSDGNLYGVTQNGGSTGVGTIFKMTPAGALTTLVSFTGTTGSFLGSSPRAALTLAADGNFYGTTATGGAGGVGTIFKVTPAGVLTTLVQFTGTTGAYPGSTPIGALTQGTDGSLYGTTTGGGVNNLGTAFKVTTTATFTSLATFSGTSGATLGSSPKGALVQMPDGNFYGTTQSGGLNAFGTVFSITPAGALTTLVNLTGSTGTALGITPQGALVAGTDGAMYGTTQSGGLNSFGTIFKVTTGGLFTTLVNTNPAPNIGRISEGPGGTFVGATLGGGGANGYGTVFAAPIGGAPATLSTLVPVSGNTALNARAGLLRGSDGNYYGTTVAGGAINSGSVFKLTPAGVSTTLISFTGTTGTNPGSSPQAALIQGGDGNYYGTTSGGGASGLGTIFMMTPAGVQTTVINFTGLAPGNLGTSPQAPLTLGTDGNFYGTTTSGGTGGSGGTIFKMTPAGVLTTLVNFTGTGAVPGTSPSGALTQAADGNFYGTTSSGGTTGLGTVFKVTPGGVFTSLANFTGTTGALPGQTPTGGLFLGRDGCLYGVTVNGGVYFQGTLFRVAPDGSVVSIYTFTGRSEGLAPNNGLVLASDGYLYGGDATAIYRLNPPPVVLAAPATSITTNSATLNGSITGETYSGTVNFEYGTTTAYGSTTAPVPFDPGITATPASTPVTGLQPFLTYHFRLVAVTSSGNFYSQDQTFSTPNTATFNSVTDVPVTSAGFTATGLPLGITLGFAPAPGTVLTLVNNTGFTPIGGTFNGLPNGTLVSATFGAQTYLFLINYAGGDGNDITLTLVTQAITFPAIASKQTADVPFTLAATASSGLPVSYTVVAGNASASVAGNTVTLTGTPGLVTIKATQPGNGTTFGPALPVTQSFAVMSGAAFTQISSSKTNSSGFTLGIRAGGTLWGWGYNANGQLGNGTTTTATVPVQIGVATSWKSVSAGNAHAVAVRTDGTLWAWGLNTYGQVGDGTNTQRTSPVQIGALTTWAAAVAGYQHTIALKTDGTLWAWGYNNDGELGQGTSDTLTTHTAPVQVGSVATWTGISTGAYHILATRSDGTLWAWGYNFYGQIGNGTTTTTTAPVQIGTATTWSTISAGYYFSLATRTDGTLWLWGRNVEGQLGDGTLTQRTAPGQLGTGTNWLNVQAGGYQVLATKADATLWSWGQNLTGQLGQGFNDITARGNIPVQIGAATNWSLLAPGYDFSVATKSDGTLWSWGDNSSNELGYLGRVPLPVAAQFGPITTASGGSGHSAMIKADGTLWLWGSNSSGQLGIGSSDSGQHPVPVQPAPGTTWKSITASNNSSHTIAVRNDGTLWSWGNNGNGQLGDGTTTQRTSPVMIGTESNWLAVAAGGVHTLALKTDGTLWSWGYNFYGQLGDGTTTQRTTPLQIGTASNWAAICGGLYHSVAIKQDGTLWVWGYNSFGQVGDGTTTQRTSPVQIGTATNWRSISAGYYHTIATRTDGTLWAWGYNFYGQLGDGTTTTRLAPQQVGTGTNWNSAAAGLYHTLGTKADGTLWTWGYNNYSQLGNATLTNRSAPAQVGTSTGWDKLFQSASQTLATTSDGTLWACGFANNGTIAYAWRNQFLPDLVLPALSPAQTVAFAPPASVPVGNTITLAAAASSGLPASYLVAGPAILNGDQLTVTGPGLVTIIAYQAGDNYWQSSDIAARYINAPPPTVAGVAVFDVTTTTATFTGTVNPNGTITLAKFQSGPTNAYGTDTLITLSPNNGVADQIAYSALTGLTPNTTYHFRVTATNSGGTTTTSDMMFTTYSTPADLAAFTPSVGTLAPAFSPVTTAYSEQVANSNSTITFTPVSAMNAIIETRVNGGPYAFTISGFPTAPLPLNTGANTVDVRVIAQDAVTVKTYTVVTTRRTPYQDWAFGLGLGGTALDPNGDLDGDGVKNIHEWAFGTNPAAGAQGPIRVNAGVLLAHGGPTVLAVPDGLGGVSYFALFGRRKDAGTVGLTYAVEFSDALSGWNVSAVSPTVIAQDSEIEAVTVPFPPAVIDPPAAFFRVRATGQ